MKLRTAAYIFAITASACIAASNQALESQRNLQVSGAAASPQTDPTTFDTLRESFQKCVDAAAGATWPTQECIADEYDYQDRRLNRAYRQLMKAVSRRDAEALRARQRAWIIERDTACPWDDDTQGQGRRLEANYCAMQRSADRATELEGQLRQLQAPTR